MKKLIAIASILLVQILAVQSAWAYLLPISGYSAGANLFINTDTIVRNPPIVTLTYVVSFDEAQSYGSTTYLSKATEVRLDCSAMTIFAIAETYYSKPNLHGRKLGRFPLSGQESTYPEPDSWVSNLVKTGCMPRRY